METSYMSETKEQVRPLPVKAENIRKTPVIYALDALDADGVIRLCALLYGRGYGEESDLFAASDEDGHTSYYLVIRDSARRGGEGLPPFAILDEYGTRVASAAMLLCLREHAVCVCHHDAVERMAELNL